MTVCFIIIIIIILIIYSKSSQFARRQALQTWCLKYCCMAPIYDKKWISRPGRGINYSSARKMRLQSLYHLCWAEFLDRWVARTQMLSFCLRQKVWAACLDFFELVFWEIGKLQTNTQGILAHATAIKHQWIVISWLTVFTLIQWRSAGEMLRNQRKVHVCQEPMLNEAFSGIMISEMCVQDQVKPLF